MDIPCFRCGNIIDTPDVTNAEYIIANDTIVLEPREVLIALKHNQATLDKKANNPEEAIADEEYDTLEVRSFEEARRDMGEDLVKVLISMKDKAIQKTGIVCPDCYRDTDTVIWGVHKEQ